MAELKDVKKAIFPVGGLGTRFLPLSIILPKELWPLVDKPVLQYIIEEAKASGIEEIIFVDSPSKKIIFDYFTKPKELEKLEKTLKQKKRDKLVDDLKQLKDLCKNISFSHVIQKKALGDGHAILMAKNKIGNDPCAVLFADDIVDSKIPCLTQLLKVFKTCQKPVLALYRLPPERLPFYGIVAVEKIANRLYKIKKIVEKPSQESAPSDLAIVGKYILTPEVFDYLKDAKPSEKGEIILAETLEKMIKNGKIIYGYEFEGKWLECGNKLGWIESNTYFSIKHPEFGPQLKAFINENKLI